MINVSVHGAEGRMGRLITALIEQSDDTRLCALFTENGRQVEAGLFHEELPLSGQSEIAALHPENGVIVDFSLAPALDGLLQGASLTKSPLLIGTTGHDQSQISRLRDFAADMPVVLASNFSIGIPVMRLLLENLATLLPQDFMAEELEIHHRHKMDKPSGTALTLA
jgi:4-hydroxy-tetrahydrodipicolinate reductase